MHLRGESGTDNMKIAIVGPCAAGKTTLINGLQKHGYSARQIAQEHSYVPDMWAQIAAPDVLIYLDASYETCTERKSLNWREDEYEEQVCRLSHARAHADLVIPTDELPPKEVLDLALQFLAEV
jgi:deoxyadenosine/deoxycytidine kinase